MPKAPIRSRILFWDYLPGSAALNPRPIYILPFCAVETALGTMVEPTYHGSGALGNKTTNVDAFDCAFTEIRQMDEGTFRSQYGSGGNQWPVDYSR